MKFEKVNTSMTVDEAMKIKKLLALSESKAVVHKEGAWQDGTPYSYNVCPSCGHVIADGSEYCRKCGQKVDLKVYAL